MFTVIAGPSSCPTIWGRYEALQDAIEKVHTLGPTGTYQCWSCAVNEQCPRIEFPDGKIVDAWDPSLF